MAIYAFTYDLVFRDLEDDSIWLGEHKSAKAIRTDHLPLDDQAGSYFAVAPIELRSAGLIGPKEKLQGIMYNFVRKAFEDDRPRNADGHYCNKPVKADYIDAFNDWSSAAGRSNRTWVEVFGPEILKLKVAEMEAFAAEHGIPVFGEVSKLQPKPRFVREPVYRTCAYHDMCKLDERGDTAAVKEYRSSMYKVEDPYADHRKSTEEA
jgi:hypothetical protein